jgi:hypothetical protein
MKQRKVTLERQNERHKLWQFCKKNVLTLALGNEIIQTGVCDFGNTGDCERKNYTLYPKLSCFRSEKQKRDEELRGIVWLAVRCLSAERTIYFLIIKKSLRKPALLMFR